MFGELVQLNNDPPEVLWSFAAFPEGEQMTSPSCASRRDLVEHEEESHILFELFLGCPLPLLFYLRIGPYGIIVYDYKHKVLHEIMGVLCKL